ncbi:MAG: AmmeMemoRadiSam system protein B [Candidatus Omnitrophota bacterium]|nr:AmmeMemoRadiSam system protein B [Candidatus Omnitrophota bacterium]
MRRICVLILSVLISSGVYAKNIKEAQFSGSFYPADKKALSSMVDRFLAEADLSSVSAVSGDVLGIISPHAGYVYSGSVAAYGYKSLAGKKFDTVILLGSSHHYRFKGISIYDDGIFNTPLGKLSVDGRIASRFSSLAFAQFNKVYFNNEHSLEVQLPFIIKSLGKVKIVPILFGEVTLNDLEEISGKIDEISKDKKVLIVVSTDLSHYLEYQQAVKKDLETVNFIKNKDASALWDSWRSGEGRGCGLCPAIAFLMYVKSQAADIEILKYANSGDTASDKGRVVGYMSAVAYKKLRTIKKEGEGMAQGDGLTHEDKDTLLKIARSTLESFLKDGSKPEVKVDSDNLKAKRGAFVTLHKNGKLRGCIGKMVADMPLYKVIPEFAIYSATEDIRFLPVSYEILKDIEIEISVLTEPVVLAVSSTQELLDKLQPLRDGVIIVTKYGSSTYLPQVWEQIPDKREFLSHLCAKGGAPADYWETNFKDIKVQTYQAIVFSE